METRRLHVVRFGCEGRHFGIARCRVGQHVYGLGLEYTAADTLPDHSLVTVWAAAPDNSLYDLVGARSGVSGRALRASGPHLGSFFDALRLGRPQ